MLKSSRVLLEASESPDKTENLEETLTFALFERTFGKKQFQFVAVEDAVVTFPLKKGLQRPADPWKPHYWLFLPSEFPAQHRHFLHISFALHFVCL